MVFSFVEIENNINRFEGEGGVSLQHDEIEMLLRDASGDGRESSWHIDLKLKRKVLTGYKLGSPWYMNSDWCFGHRWDHLGKPTVWCLEWGKCREGKSRAKASWWWAFQKMCLYMGVSFSVHICVCVCMCIFAHVCTHIRDWNKERSNYVIWEMRLERVVWGHRDLDTGNAHLCLCEWVAEVSRGGGFGYEEVNKQGCEWIWKSPKITAEIG